MFVHRFKGISAIFGASLLFAGTSAHADYDKVHGCAPLTTITFADFEKLAKTTTKSVTILYAFSSNSTQTPKLSEACLHGVEDAKHEVDRIDSDTTLPTKYAIYAIDLNSPDSMYWNSQYTITSYPTVVGMKVDKSRAPKKPWLKTSVSISDFTQSKTGMSVIQAVEK
jgi:hypothetical protein